MRSGGLEKKRGEISRKYDPVSFALSVITGFLIQRDMKIKFKDTSVLEDLRQQCPQISVSDYPNIVIFSDLHMGNGGSRDDFRHNGYLVTAVLQQYYQNYALVLNGDIEDIQKFRRRKIMRAWKELFDVFWQFHHRGMLFKIIGNHDWALQALPERPEYLPLIEGLRIMWNQKEFFVFHGHQLSRMYELFEPLITLGLRILAVPLGFANVSVAHDNDKKYKLEKQVYEFSRERRIASMIGHTHRPLFESLSKRDVIRYKVEHLLRTLHFASQEETDDIEEEILAYKQLLLSDADFFEINSLLYSDIVPIPCLFNSGGCIGNRGVTCLEIQGDEILLVHWFDEQVSSRYMSYEGYETHQLPGTSICRTILKQENLGYLFNSIDLLS